LAAATANKTIKRGESTLINGTFGVQLGSHIRATDAPNTGIFGFQACFQLPQRLLTCARRWRQQRACDCGNLRAIDEESGAQTCADDNGVHSKHALLSTYGNLHSFITNSVVGAAADALNSIVLESVVSTA
jgi:hypothetical protein